jgi:hypothetical protein
MIQLDVAHGMVKARQAELRAIARPAIHRYHRSSPIEIARARFARVLGQVGTWLTAPARLDPIDSPQGTA